MAKIARSPKPEPMTVRKSGGRPSFGQSLLIFLLVCAAGYNAYETAQLKREIADLKAKPHAAGASAKPLPDGIDTQPSSLFAQAQREVSAAEAKLHLKDYAKARTDLQNGVASLERANAQTRAQGEKVLAELRTAAQSLQDKTIDSTKASHAPAHGAVKESGASSD